MKHTSIADALAATQSLEWSRRLARACSALKAIADAQQRMSQLKLPLLVMYATADGVNLIEDSQAFGQVVASADKTLNSYPGVYHDMLNEPERDQIAVEIVSWLLARTK